MAFIVRLGQSGLKVSKIIMALMSFGDSSFSPWLLPEDDCIKFVKAAYDAGIQAFDTANAYSNGKSEIMLGNAIKQLQLPREELVILTKPYFPIPSEFGRNIMAVPDPDTIGFVNQHGLSRKHIFDSVKASLKRLQLDYIDVLQCHRFDYNTPFEETMQALHDVVQAGYVRYIGMSSCHAYQYYAIQNKLTLFISMQNHCSLLYREEEREMFPTLKMFGVGSILWSPLARGLLSRPRGEQTKRGESDRMIKMLGGSDAAHQIVDRVEEIAKKRGINMSQVALAWTLAQPGVTAPIVGTTKLENLQDSIESVHVKLTEEEVKYLDEPYAPQQIIGHS
ncbi:Aldo keto reductase [Coniophora puteana RWD-64-598 SS2]|uniref:Aldo keto reductase n=1 Tax=Coniophora puteana (strain RWD-64-598) TaxID=741705 RepID=A0A5M3MYD0_CONPW|nr:Aldo keto reductase [Coniophora puteana RWD-64-598 SS2]EIW83665.1 Aldo keto reductase [Coniophora puteana RWD-64-598 SS2]